MKGRIIIILQMVSWLLFYECSQFWLLFSFFWTRKKLSWRFPSEKKSDGNSYMLEFSICVFDFWFYTNKLHGGRGDQGNLSAMTVFINTPLRFIVQFDICNPWTRLAVNINKPWIRLTNTQFMQIKCQFWVTTLRLGGDRCKVFEKSKYFDSESVTSLITSLKAISRNLISHIAKQYLEKDSILAIFR